MLIVCFGGRGGVGTTVLAGSLALAAGSGRAGVPVLLVDLAGSLPVLFGTDAPEHGVADWLEAGDEVAPDALARMEVDLGSGIGLLARGVGSLDGPRVGVLAALLRADARLVIVDAGLGSGQPAHLASALVGSADASLLVARACPLARSVGPPGLSASGMVVVRDPGRALRASDLEVQGGPSAVAELALDPAVGRAVDAGFGSRPLPSAYLRALRAVLAALR